MRLHFYWIDKNWQHRGYARNYNVVVDFKRKTYYIYINSYYDYNTPDDIEIKTKNNILRFVEYLKYENFKIEKEYNLFTRDALITYIKNENIDLKEYGLEVHAPSSLECTIENLEKMNDKDEFFFDEEDKKITLYIMG